jgi:hypothetical protein
MVVYDFETSAIIEEKYPTVDFYLNCVDYEKI